MYTNWIEDQNEEVKTLDNQGYLIGSFINPEAVKKIIGKDANTISQTDEEFDKNSGELFKQFREEDAQAEPLVKRKRKRKKIKE
jgi:hypothetical protein